MKTLKSTDDYNTGSRNTGNKNTGNKNTGSRNTGYYNTGDYNTGYYNTGDYNTGYYNTGDYNTGDYNTGYYNTGYYNTGDYNIGYYNTGDYNTGYFNTNSPKVRLFNKDSALDFDDPILFAVQSIIYKNVKSLCTWIFEESMTTKEKVDFPTYKTTGGYLKKRDYKYCWQKGWERMIKEEKQKIKDLPNFDPVIFEEITGINVNDDYKIITVDNVDYKIKKEDFQELLATKRIL